MFEGIFTELRGEGVSVALDEWLMLHDSTLSGFYLMARSLLVKNEPQYFAFDIAFARYFNGIKPAAESVDDRVWKWLHENPEVLELSKQ